MMYVYTETSVFGPFDNVAVIDNIMHADDIAYPLEVIGHYTICDHPPRFEVTPAVQQRIITHITNTLDNTAKGLGYDSIISACTYATCDVPKFASEGQALLNWRARMWATAYDIRAQVEVGTLKVSSEEEIIAMLPAYPGVA